MTISLNVILFLVLPIIILLGLIFFIFWYKRSINKHIELEILSFKIPKYTQKDQEILSKEYINSALGKIENLFTALAGLKAEKTWKKEQIFSLEMVALDGEICFYAAVPKKLKEFFIQQFQAAYPKIYFEEIPDYNIFEANSAIKAGALRLKNDFALPIKTYHVFENDPLESITNALSKLNEHEAAAVQYVFRSANKSWHQRGRKIIKHMQEGMSLKAAVDKAGTIGFAGFISATLSFIASFFKSSDKEKDTLKNYPEKNIASAKEQEISKLLEDKNSKPAMDVNIRIVVASQNIERSKMLLDDVLNSYAQYNIYEFGNSFEAQIPRNPDKIIEEFIFRQFKSNRRLLLNAEEMVSMIHLPLPTTETPNIAWLEAVKAPPPNNMPQNGLILGKSSYRGRETLVRIKDNDRRRHMYIIGQTGVGKSVLQESLIVQDIQSGKGVCVVDPHGDLVEAIMSHIPKERAEDVILFDPANSDRPLGMNMLEYDTEEQKSFVINEMIAIFDKLYNLKATGGPMFEQYMRNAMLLIMDDKNEGATLLEIPKILADANFRKQKLAKVSNQFVKDFWEKEAEKAGGEAALANMVPYITSKLTPFISNDLIRPIIAQSKSAFNFREAMDSGKIVLLNLSKGKIGETNSSLLV
jgi:hypothetical protein